MKKALNAALKGLRWAGEHANTFLAAGVAICAVTVKGWEGTLTLWALAYLLLDSWHLSRMQKLQVQVWGSVAEGLEDINDRLAAIEKQVLK